MILAIKSPKKKDHNPRGSFSMSHSSSLDKSKILDRIPPKTAIKNEPLSFFQKALNPSCFRVFSVLSETELMLCNSSL